MAWTTPLTFVAGTKHTAAALNAGVRDDLLWLYSGSGWVAITLNAGYTAASAANRPSSKLVGTEVRIEGWVTKTTAWAASMSHDIGTIDATMRPPATVIIPTSGTSVAISTGVRTQITTDGVVAIVTGTTAGGAGTNMYLDGIRYDTVLKT